MLGSELRIHAAAAGYLSELRLAQEMAPFVKVCEGTMFREVQMAPRQEQRQQGHLNHSLMRGLSSVAADLLLNSGLRVL